MYLSPKPVYSLIPAIKRNSDISIGRDSGQGDSLTSNIYLFVKIRKIIINYTKFKLN